MRTTRRHVWDNLVWRRSVIAIALLTTVLGTLTLWWDELFPALARPHLTTLVHAIHWWYWVIGGLITILVLVVEETLKLINKSEDQLEEYKSKGSYLPNISIVLHSLSIGGNVSIPNTMSILTILSVRNTGAPSIVENWALKLDDYPDQRVTLIEDLVWQYPNARYTYSAEDHIHKKVAENPVPAGAKKVGFMLWRASGFDRAPLLKDRTAIPKVTITARDVVGNLITAQSKAANRDDIWSYYPGLLGPKGHLEQLS